MDFGNETFENLDRFFEDNHGICFRTIDLDNDQEFQQLSFSTVEQDRSEIIAQLKAWKRLLAILPECDREKEIIKGLLKKNIYSALHIAAIPKQQFIKECGDIFNDNGLLEATYKNANALRTQVLLRYMNIKQNSESHIKATLFHK